MNEFIEWLRSVTDNIDDNIVLKVNDKTISIVNVFNYKNHDNKNLCIDIKSKHSNCMVVFSDELYNRKKQWEGYLKSFLFSKEKISGRDCEIKEIGKLTGRNFIDEYHVQGSNNLGIVFFGLFHGAELVGCMSLGRHPRGADETTIILDRLCFKSGCQIIGGASKLFKACVKWATTIGYRTIVSWSDNRWSEGIVYHIMKFKFDKEYDPDYSYINIKTNTRLSKQSQKKDLTGCPKDITELEWSIANGLVRIWDLGKKKWVYNLDGNSTKEKICYKNIQDRELTESNRQKSNEKAKRYREKNKDRLEITIFCGYCNKEHTVTKWRYEKNIEKNGHYICMREGGSISGKKSKMILNPYKNEGKKQCNSCKEIKPFEDFNKDSSRADGYRGTCRDCHNNQRTENITIHCDFCKKDHIVSKSSYERNLGNNGRYICIWENGVISGHNNKKVNPYAAEGKKQCNLCNEIKPFEDFNKNSSKADGYQGLCRDCQKQHSKKEKNQ